ncbi:hypothetical protein D3C75_224110 [compost metagenome]
MNALSLKQAMQKALELLEDLPADMPVNLCGSDGLIPLEAFSVYLTNEEGNEREAGDKCASVTVVVD